MPAAQNGYSGRIVREEVLKPLGLSFEETWLTDVVNTFLAKNGPDSQGDDPRTGIHAICKTARA